MIMHSWNVGWEVRQPRRQQYPFGHIAFRDTRHFEPTLADPSQCMNIIFHNFDIEAVDLPKPPRRQIISVDAVGEPQ